MCRLLAWGFVAVSRSSKYFENSKMQVAKEGWRSRQALYQQSTTGKSEECECANWVRGVCC